MLFLKVFLLFVTIEVGQSSSCSTFLTVSTREFIYYRSNLVINWGPNCEKPPTSIKLYDYNPYHVKKPMQLFSAYPSGQKVGQVETSIRLNDFKLPFKWDSKTELNESLSEESYQKCLDFYIVSYNETNHAIGFDCLKIRPQWMSESHDIWNMKLKDLYIPGTHCSGCYMTWENAKDKKENGFLQNFDVWHQLVLGIRHLDFSIGVRKQLSHSFFNSQDQFYEKIFWIKSGDLLISPLLRVLADVAKFAERSKEILILNFSGFSEEFSETPEMHEVLKHFIGDEIGALAFVKYRNSQNSFDLTIQEMKNNQKYLLITYNQETDEIDSTIFWPTWQGSNEIETSVDVNSYLKNAFANKFRAEINDGWILSMNVDNFKSDDNSKRRKAAAINSKALFPLGGPWSLKTNVVSLDFAFATNFMDVAVYVNQLKGAAHGNFTVIDMS